MKLDPRISTADIERMRELVPGGFVADQFVKPIVTVKITGTSIGAFTLGGGKYTGRMVVNEVTPDDTAWLESDLDDDDLAFLDSDDCYVLNYAEKGASTHVLDTGTYVNGNVIGHAPDGRYVVAVDGAGSSGLFPVLVAKDGGSNGSASTAASWTYTVTSLGGVELGTSVAVSRPRPNGLMTFQSGSEGYGVAFYDEGELKLWDAGEVPTTGACT